MAIKYKSKFTGEQIDNSVETVVSNTATSGQVLTANGTGGATWQDASGGGTEVVANPVLAGTESDLTGLEVAGTKYKVPTGGGTEVVANPSLAGTESDLTGLEVAGTKYKVPTGGSGGGTQLYLHVLVNENYEYSFISKSSAPISVTLKKRTYKINNMCDAIPYSHTYVNQDVNTEIRPVIMFYTTPPGNDEIMYIGNNTIVTIEVTSTNWTDTVTPL